MNRRFWFDAWIIAGFCFFTGSVWGGLRDVEEEAVAVLMDSRAGSNQKIEAIRVLEGASYREDGFDRVVFALVRQCHYDMEPVREMAREAVVNVFEKGPADRMIAAYLPQTEHFYEDFRVATKGWENSNEICAALAGNDAVKFHEAMERLAALAKGDPNHLVALNLNLQARLVVHLERIDLFDPTIRRAVLVLVKQLDALRPEALPLIWRAMADDDVESRKFVSELGISDAKHPSHYMMAAACFNAIANPDRRIAAAAVGMVLRLPEETRKREARQFIWALVEAASHGNVAPLVLLKQPEISPAQFAMSVHEKYLFSGAAEQVMLIKVLGLAGVVNELEKSADLRETFSDLLLPGEGEFSISAAELFNTPALRPFALEKIIASVKSGKAVPAEIVKVFKPEAEMFSRELLEAMRGGQFLVVRASLKALAVSGIEGDAIRAALAPLVRSQDMEIRREAALLLNTPEALARARVPELLLDIQSESPALRQLGARQLDELGIEPRELTAALIRAVDGGDFAARLGFVKAMESADRSGGKTLEELKKSAAAENPDAAGRAYARAALREMKR